MPEVKFSASAAGRLLRLTLALDSTVLFAPLLGVKNARSKLRLNATEMTDKATTWISHSIVATLPATLATGEHTVEVEIHDPLIPGGPHTGSASFPYTRLAGDAPLAEPDLGFLRVNPGVASAGSEVDVRFEGASSIAFVDGVHVPTLTRAGDSVPGVAPTPVGGWGTPTLKLRLPTAAQIGTLASAGEPFVLRLGNAKAGLVGPLTIAVPGAAVPGLDTKLPTALGAKFKVTFDRFEALVETYDDALQHDGQRDEVFMMGEAVRYNLVTQEYEDVTEERSVTWGDDGVAEDPNRHVVDGGIRPGSPHAPKFAIWEGRLEQPSDAVAIAPFLMEWDLHKADDMLPDDAWKSAFQNAAYHLVTALLSQLTQLGLPELGELPPWPPGTSPLEQQHVLRQVDVNVPALEELTLRMGKVSAGHRPIGTVGVTHPDDMQYVPHVLVLTYTAAKALSLKQLHAGRGMLKLELQDREPHVGSGKYEIFIKVEEVAGSGTRVTLGALPLPSPQVPFVVLSRVLANPVGRDVQPDTGEHFVLRNLGGVRADVSNWYVDDAAAHRFQLGPNRRIDPLGYLRVYTGAGTSTATHLYTGLNTPLINNLSPERLSLYRPPGTKVSEITY